MPDTKTLYKGTDGESWPITLTDDGHHAAPYVLTDDSERLDLRREDAIKIAKAILENESVEPPPLVVKASEVSFNEGLLRLAAAHERQVTFRYAKGDGKTIETRTLVPQEVREVKGNLIFLGHDPDRNDIRAYRVDRMKGEVQV